MVRPANAAVPCCDTGGSDPAAGAPEANRGGACERDRHAPPRLRRSLPAPMILAIDQGTTGTTCLVFDDDGALAGRAYREFTQHFPRPGWVEHDAAEIWEVTEAVAREALDDAGVDQPAAIGITNQRETVCVWDPCDRRAAAPRARLAGPPHRRPLRRAARAGPRGARPRQDRARPRPVLQRDEDRVAAATTSTACASGRATAAPCSARSTPGSIFKLTGELVTDVTNASRTLLYDMQRGPRGTPSCSTSSASPSARCRASCRASARSAARREGVPVAGHRRRPAGRALRPGLPRPGPGQEHVRHRLVRPAQHRRRGARPAGGPARHRRLGDRRAPRSTRSRRRSSSPARRCSGCATGWGSSRRAPETDGDRRGRWTRPRASCSSPR